MFVNFPSIDSFHKPPRHMRDRKVAMFGTVKVHGTNAGINFFDTGEVTFQSRNREITLESDNAGFASAMNGLVKPIHENITVYGEWFGGNIQTGVAVNGAPKTFMVFAIVNRDTGELLDEVPYQPQLPTEFLFAKSERFNVARFMNISLNDPEVVQSVVDLTLQVEENCPVGAFVAPDNECTIGEGIVWDVYSADLQHFLGRLKSKGEKHKRKSTTKVKAPKVSNIPKELADQVDKAIKTWCSVDRLEQGIEYLVEMELDPSDMRNLGTYLQWVSKDILKEEDVGTITCLHEELEWKTLAKTITQLTKEYYIARSV